MKTLFDTSSFKCSKSITREYSTSFSSAVSLLSKEIRNAIYSIYGFVRLADEIVDSFHDYDKKELLDKFVLDSQLAIKNKISLNPILNAFQNTVVEYDIENELIDAFLKSMRMDLEKVEYNGEEYKEYIYGSADVVGLMCLRVFTKNDKDLFEELKVPAMRLGSAFQKVNFLRDLNQDFKNLQRMYFPGVNFFNFSKEDKMDIEKEIEEDFKASLIGIKNLPYNSKLGVYIAYAYYNKLFKKIKRKSTDDLLKERVRIPSAVKYQLLLSSYLKHKFKIA